MRPRATRGSAAIAAALLAVCVSVAGLTAPGGAAAAFQAVGAVPSLPRGAVLHGAVAPGTEVHLDVGLAVRDPVALDALLHALYSPGSAAFHHFLARGEFAARFGASPAELGRVEGWLRSDGLTPTGVSESRLTIHVAATAAAVAAALRAPLDQVRLADGHLDFANRLAPMVPSPLASDVSGIVGLSDLPAVTTDLVAHAGARKGHAVTALDTGTAAAKACVSAEDAARNNGSFTVAGFASFYAISPLYKLGDRGGGVRVAVAEFEPNRTSDVAAYQHCYGTSASVRYVHVDGGVGTGAGQGEAALDIEDVIGLAPKASLDVYQGPVSALGNDDEYARIVGDDLDKVVTTSYGMCEPLVDPALITAENATFAQAATQGQVVFAAAGDTGSTDCYGSGVPSLDAMLAVDDPASQPNVVGVGGTTATSHGEAVWNNSGSGGGGGISVVECMSSTQDNPSVPGVISAFSVADPTLCPTAPSYPREVPDVAAVADPSTGYTVYWRGQWGAIGGTSAAAPLWAAVASLVDASPYCHAMGSKVGVDAASLYGLAATPSYGQGFFDVTSGNNVVLGSGYKGTRYAATPGYDEASGLGTPQVTHYVGPTRSDLFHPGLASLLCYEQRTVPIAPVVSGVVPNRVASDQATPVTILGTGFLPVTGAVHLAVDGLSIVATCTTATRCTASLPGAAPVTADVRVLDQTYAESPVGTADLVTFVAAPTISSLSPSKGRTKGGTRVTITGSGFTGHVTVRFGSRLATKLDVKSATTLVVSAPRGTGTVTVAVTATGGVSRPVAADRYRY